MEDHLDNTDFYESIAIGQRFLFGFYTATWLLFTITAAYRQRLASVVLRGIGALAVTAVAFMGLVPLASSNVYWQSLPEASDRSIEQAQGFVSSAQAQTPLALLLLALMLKIKMVVAGLKHAAQVLQSGGPRSPVIIGVLNSDAENIPFDLGIFWFSLTTIRLARVQGPEANEPGDVGKWWTYSNLFIGLLTLYTALRFGHTACYALALPKPRTTCWACSKLFLLISAIAAFVCSFDIRLDVL